MSVLLSEFWPYIAGGLAFLAGVFGVYRKGRRDESNKHKIKEMERNHETRKRMDDIDTSGDNADWLRERAGK